MTILSTAAPRDYAWLKAAVARWLHRSDLTEQVADFIALAEARMYRELRIRAMESALTGTTTDAALALPSDYVELKHARVDGYAPLERKPIGWLHETYPQGCSGTPRYFATDADSLILMPEPADGTAITGTYYARLADLSDDNPDNWFTINAPDLLLFAALCEAAPFIQNDARIVVWESKYAALKDAIQAEDRKEAHSGSALTLSFPS